MQKLAGPLAILATTSAAICGMASAQDYPTEAFSTLGLAGSESLAVYALTRPQTGPQGLAHGINLLGKMGVLGEPGQITDRWFSWSPLLTYDSNLNGGFAQDSFIAGGLPFQVAEEYVAVSGVLVGAQASAGLRMHAFEDTALELRGGARVGWAPEQDISKSQFVGEACLKHMVSTENFVHGCTDYLHADYKLGTTDRAGARVGATHAFMSSVGFHEVTAELQRLEYLGGDSYGQNVVSLSATSALTNGVAFFAGIQLGDDAGTNQVMRRRVEVGASTMIADRPVSVRVSAEEDRGGLFLGEARRDMTYGVSVSAKLADKLSATAVYSVTDASHEFYDSDSLGFSLNMKF